MKEYRESLINKIRRLYTELFLVALHNRIDSYHSFLHSNKHNELSVMLHEVIDEIVKEASRNYSVEDYRNIKFKGVEGSSTSDPDMPNSIYNHSANMGSMTLNGLSIYLKKQQAQENDPHMSIKLQRCVWDHVHSAHRFAREGDRNTAKLHADIACNAIKALSHYMPAEEYSDFFNEIGNQLQPIEKSI